MLLATVSGEIVTSDLDKKKRKDEEILRKGAK